MQPVRLMFHGIERRLRRPATPYKVYLTVWRQVCVLGERGEPHGLDGVLQTSVNAWQVVTRPQLNGCVDAATTIQTVCIKLPSYSPRPFVQGHGNIHLTQTVSSVGTRQTGAYNSYAGTRIQFWGRNRDTYYLGKANALGLSIITIII